MNRQDRTRGPAVTDPVLLAAASVIRWAWGVLMDALWLALVLGAAWLLLHVAAGYGVTWAAAVLRDVARILTAIEKGV